LLVNLIVILVLRQHHHDDLNVRSAFLHVVGDALSSLGVIAAGIIMLLTGWTVADPIVSALIGLVILLGSGRVLRESLHILVEGTPTGISATQVAQAMSEAAGVEGVHDLHIWTVSPGYVALSAHVVLADQSLTEAERIREALRQILGERFGIHHTTVQLECGHCGQCLVTSWNGGV